MDQLLEAVHALATVDRRESRARSGIGIEADDGYPAAREALRHIGAHAPESHHANVQCHRCPCRRFAIEGAMLHKRRP
jgi:hypothetical protein